MPRSFPTTRQFHVQGQILLERALFCVGCEVIFAGAISCPRCGGGTVWPLAEWLRSARLSPAATARPGREAPDAQAAPQGHHTLPAA
jgi:hypothetical protein